MFFQKRKILLLKGAISVPFILRLDIVNCIASSRNTYTKCPISLLPCEVVEIWKCVTLPFWWSALYQLCRLCDRYRCGQRNESMYMIRCSTNHHCPHIVFFGDATYISPQSLLHFSRYNSLPILGAENVMYIATYIGMRHLPLYFNRPYGTYLSETHFSQR